MNHIDATVLARLLEPALAVRLTLTLLHFLWQGALLGLVAFAADRALRRASSPVRYAVFAGVLVAMGAALPVTFALIHVDREQDEIAPAVTAGPAPIVFADASPATQLPPVRAAVPQVASQPHGEPMRPPSPEPAEASAVPLAPATQWPGPRIEAYAASIALAYIAGLLLMLARLAVALQGGRRLRLAATPIPDGPIYELVRRQANQLGLKTAPPVAWCGRISVPVVVAIVRPIILLPTALATGFDPSQLEAILTHELAHIRRFDPLVNLLQRLIEVLLFFHPAVWYVSRRVSAERENACDDLVLWAGWPPIAYADALLRMAERSAAAEDSRTHQTAGAALPASGGGATQFKRRVLRLLEIGDSPRVRLSRGGLLLLAGAAVVVVLSSPLIRRVAIKLEESKAEQRLAQVPAGTQSKAEVQSQNASPSQSAAESETLARVFAAWKKREEHASSFHVTWQTRVTIPKSARFSFDDRLMAGLSSVGPYDTKAVDFTFPPSNFWGWGDNTWRRDFPRVLFGSTGTKHVATEQVLHVGNTTYRLEVRVGDSRAPWTSVLHEEGTGHSPSNARELNFAPLRLALRPFSQWSPAKCRVVNENANVYGVPCIEIQMEDGEEKCWVDPKRDYVVVFYEQGQYYRTHSVFVEYQRTPADGWVPSRWMWEEREKSGTGETRPDGAAAIFHTAVTHYALNEKFAENPLLIVAPAGTLAYDLTPVWELEGAAQQAPTAPSAEDRKTLEAIKTAWSQRQARFKSFRFTSKREPSSGLWEGPTIRTACGDGNKFALEFSETPVTWQRKTAFDGSVTRSVWLSKGRGAGDASVKTGIDASFFHEVGNVCLWLGLCPLETPLGRSDPSTFRVVSHSARIDGTPRGRAEPSKFRRGSRPPTSDDTPCVVVETEVTRRSRTLLWLDPAREYVILRRDQIYGKDSGERKEFFYRLDPKQGWIPSEWKYVTFGMRGEMAWGSASRAPAGVALAETVTDYSINEPIPPAAFRVDFPEGVPVEDKGAREARETKGMAAAADKIAARWAKPPVTRPAEQALRDPQYDSWVSLNTALNAASATGKYVLIEFGGQGHPDCGQLYALLKGNAELAARLRKGFCLVLVDTDYRDPGKVFQKQYVPERLRKTLPAICVLDAGRNVLNVDDTTGLKTGNNYDVEKVRAYLEKWSPQK